MKTTPNTIAPQRLVSCLPPLRAKAVIAELRSAIQPYLFYWEEWQASEYCNLDEADIQCIDAYIKIDFNVSLFDFFMPSNRIVFLRDLLKKLESGYPVFKELVILQFLLEIIRLGKAYGDESYYDSPLSLLHLSDALKASFRAFGVFCVRQIFYSYNERQFNAAWVYDRIVNFHLLLKSGTELLTLKIPQPMVNSK